MNKKLFLSMALLFCVLAFPLRAAGVAAPQRQSGPVAILTVTPEGLVWQPLVEAAGWKLRVAGPEGVIFDGSFEAAARPAFALTDTAGKPLPDGVYIYELWGEAPVSEEARAQLEAAGGAAERRALVEELQKAGKLPSEPFYMGGTFTVLNGAARLPDPLAREETQPVKINSPLAPNDQVIADDLIVQGNACIGRASYGTDCADGMIFSISPLMLSDLYPRIFFDDTSAAVSPTNDWVILINDTYTGGSEYFAIQDEDGGTVPFKILAGAPNNALYVAADGDIGMGTTTPDAALHVTRSINPSFVFEQTSTAQQWTLVGNDTAFTLYDETHFLWPLEVEANAPSNSLFIGSTGSVGIGTSSPDARLTVVGGDLHAGGFRVASGAPANSLFLNNSGLVGIGTGSPGAKLHLVGGVAAWPLIIDNSTTANSVYVTNIGNVGLGINLPAAKLHVVGGMLADGFTVEASTPANTLYVDSTGNVGIGTNAPSTKLYVAGNSFVSGNAYVNGNLGVGTTTPAAKLHVAGDLRVDGFVNERSDVAAKTAFAAVDNQTVLERLASVPITTWSYKDSPEVRHMGPTAQDFRLAYSLGSDDQHLAALDVNGVALAAIQALDAKAMSLEARATGLESQVKEKDVRIQTLQGQVDELRIRMQALEGGAVAQGAASLGSQMTPLVSGLLGVLAGMVIARKKR